MKFLRLQIIAFCEYYNVARDAMPKCSKDKIVSGISLVNIRAMHSLKIVSEYSKLKVTSYV